MANNSKVIKTLVAGNYTGTYEAAQAPYTISGTVNTDGQKNLQAINGQVKQGQAPKASFTAYKSGEKFIYNFSDIQELSEMSAITEAVESAVAQVVAELTPAE